MAVNQPEVQPLQRVWKKAVEEYTAQLRKAGQTVDLEKWSDVANVEDLVSRLDTETEVFNEDASRGSKVTSALKMGFAPVTLLMNTLGGPASAAFAPCSQIFGAVAVLITAAEKTGAAFDDIAGLFKDLSRSTQMLKSLTKRKPPPQLEQIIQGILVCLLTVCALATKRTYHVPEQKKHRSARQVLGGVKANVGQFGKQLLFGEDAEINGAKATLQYLSESQAQLVGVLTLEKVGDLQEDTARMESVVVHINGLSLEISSAVVELQNGVDGVKLYLEEVGDVVLQLDFKISDIRDNMLTKADQKESLAMFNERFDRLERLARGPKNTKTEKTALSKTALMHSKRLQHLKDTLKPQEASRSFYKRVADGEMIPGTGDWILQRPDLQNWLEGKQAVMCLSGEAGFGKTFLAARIVKHILSMYPQGVQSPSAFSLGYFFAKSELKELRSVRKLLSTAAFQVAQNDKVYAGYLDVNLKDLDLDGGDINTVWQTLFLDYFGDARGTTYLVVDAIDECDDDDVEAFLAALKATSDRSGGWPNDLRLLLVHNSDIINDVKVALGDHASYLALEKADMIDDIAKVVDQKIATAWSQKLVTPAIHKEVRHAVFSAPQANFLWCCLVIEDLTSISREDIVRARLQDLPSDVNAAMLLLLSRLARHLDEYAIEDLNALLAWVECSHEYLSLSTLDAILTLRKPGGARIMNLDELLQEDFAGLFVTSTDEAVSGLPSEEKIRQRLQDERNSNDEMMSVVDHATVYGTEAGGDLVPTTALAESFVDHDSNFDRKLDAWSKVTVRLTHRLVKQYIEERTVKDDLKLMTNRSYANVLIGCLQFMCEPHSTHDEKTVGRASKYTSIYLPEHLSDVEPDSVDAETVQIVVTYLLQLLRDEITISLWITYAADYMNRDLLQESDFQDSVCKWFRAARDMSPAEQKFVSDVLEDPVTFLYTPLSRCLTFRWLNTDEKELSSWVVFLIDWLERANGAHRSSQIDKADQETYGLEGRALRVLQAARWTGQDESAHFFQRVGDALQDDEFEMPDAARSMYLRGIDLDNAISRLHAGLARTWKTKYESSDDMDDMQNALLPMVKAVELCRSQLGAEDQTDDTDLEGLLSEYLFDLGVYYDWTDDVELSNNTFESLLQDWENTLSDDIGIAHTASYWWLQLMQERSNFTGAASVFRRMVEHPLAQAPTFHAVYINFIETPDALLQVAYETKTFELLDQFWLNAISSCARYGDDGEVSAVRYHRAFAILTLCPSHTDEAITDLGKVLTDVEVARPTNDFNWIKESAESDLARVYFQRALEARDEDRWPQVGVNIDKLVHLCRTDPDADQGEIVNRECSGILAAWNRLNGQRSRAMQCARPRLKNGINILTDADPTNDEEAWLCFRDASLAIGDVERAATAVGMQKQLAAFGTSAIRGVTEEVQAVVEDAEAGAELEDDTVPSRKQEDEIDMTNEANGSTASSEEPESEVDEPSGGAEDDDATSDNISASDSEGDDDDSVIEQEKPIARDSARSHPDAVATKEDSSDVAGAVASLQVSVGAGKQEDEAQPDNESKEHSEDGGNDGSEDEDEDEDEEEDDTIVFCDGPCFKSISDKRSWWKCISCTRDLCESCHNLVTNDKMEGFQVCSKLHERYLMPALGERYEPGYLEVNGKPVLIADWLKELKVAWGIPVV